MRTHTWRVRAQVAFTLIFNVFFNYLSTVLTPPGHTPSEYVSPVRRTGKQVQGLRVEGCGLLARYYTTAGARALKCKLGSAV